MEENSFQWKTLLQLSNFNAAPVSCFKHVPLSCSWNHFSSPSMMVELKSPVCTTCAAPCCYWLASVLKVSGYYILLRYEGFDDDWSQDFWVNLGKATDIHPVGWCADNGMPLVPPKSIEEKYPDWKVYLNKRIHEVRTIKPDFKTKIEEHKSKWIKKGMKLEAVDKDFISAVRLATVDEVIGGRLHIKYQGSETEDEGFWCHSQSTSIHPIGWSQIIGHPFKGSQQDASMTILQALTRADPEYATWDMFPRTPAVDQFYKFERSIKLEALDPSNMNNICVATVTEVLRNNYFMVSIDGAEESSFCVHSSSPYIFPMEFCLTNGIALTPPKGYKGEFNWKDYLRNTTSVAASEMAFNMDVPDHGFVEGAYVEAVDLLEPKLICVATVVRVVGRLLRIHFEGWDAAFDQWCDCESPDLYPVGWCEMVGYKLEPPRAESVIENVETKNVEVKKAAKPRRRRRSIFAQRRRRVDTSIVKTEPMDLDIVKSELDDMAATDFQEDW